jgi:membrane protein implicated in regulation of membrane protease activity
MEGYGKSLMRSSTGLVLIVAGVMLVLAGLLAWTGMLSWFGRLPGDIRIERPNMRIYVPLTSMIIVSVVLSLLMAIVRRIK